MKGVKESQKLIARCRWGNEEEKNKYWLTDEKKSVKYARW